MPFLKFSRDKRGYEHYYLMEPPAVGRRGGGKGRPRLLFWFRTPPHVKVGREPFADDVRQTIEAQHPDIRFDWPRIMATPIPPPDVEHWRERRRAEKAVRHAARHADADSDTAPAQDAEPALAAVEADVPDAAAEPDASTVAPRTAETPPASSDMQAAGPDGRRRRRRRRGRRGRPDQPQPAGAPGEIATPDAPANPGPPQTNEV